MQGRDQLGPVFVPPPQSLKSLTGRTSLGRILHRGPTVSETEDITFQLVVTFCNYSCGSELGAKLRGRDLRTQESVLHVP